MKSFKLLLFFLFAFAGISSAQILTPAHWSHTVKDIGKGEFDVIVTVKLDEGWHVFSKDYVGVSVPSTLTLEKSSDFVEIGKFKEAGKLEKEYVKEIDETLLYYKNKAVFSQKIKLLKNDAVLKGSLEYMTCKESCLPPTTYDFELKLHTDDLGKNNGETPVKVDSLISESDSSKTDTVKTNTNNLPADSTSTADFNKQFLQTNDGVCGWEIFFGGFLGGLLALLTPCVFPMIPLTVSFFTKRTKDKKKGIANALIYALSIIVIYVFLGFAITKLLGSDALNDMASNVYFNMGFFIIFVIFAISFFGAFEITLPSSWVNKSESMSDRGGLIGIFFMAFTLALVSFSCTGPIIGSLLVQAAVGGNDTCPLIGMFGFSLALALPFGLFSLFPGWLNSLPKSGGWLNSVKVVLGFIELALALKFFSNVDLAYHWHLLDREVFLVLWIVIFSLLGFYLLGKLKFSHDSDIKYVSIPRLFFAIATLSFALYMVPGLWGAPLKAISAFSPPQATQDFDLSRLLIEGSSNSAAHSTKPKKYDDVFHMPHGIDGYFDYEEGIQAAKELGKPVMLDFTGWACVNCRKMEAAVWSDANVLKRMKENYVVISMFVDDKTLLPETQQYVSSFSGNKIKTLGNWYSDIQASNYQTNTQPFYVLLDNNKKLLNEPRSYNEDIVAYVKWLDKGLEEYKNRPKNN